MNDKSVLKSTWAAAFTVASVWFGTHVGGGFASGNQVIQYYSNYGYTSVIFPILAMGLLAVVMYIMMKFAKLSGFTNYKDTYAALYPKPWMEVFFEIFYIVIVLAAMASAVAGAGEVLASFIGVKYIGAGKVTMNLVVVAALIILTIFGIKLVRAASTVLSVSIIVITALLVVFGLTADYDSIAAQLTSQYNVELAEYTNATATAIWKGVLVYAAFQCVSIPPMIAAANELSLKGVKKANILGWLMNGLALAASGWMLTKWYPLLASLDNAGKEFLAANPTATAATDPIVAYATALGIPNQTVLNLIGIKWLLVAFSVLLFCAFMSTCVTLVYTMIQRFEGKFFPNTIKNDKLRGTIVAALVIAICFAISLLGLTKIVKYAYGYDGYYSIVVIVIPAFIWGIPKIKKLEAAKKAE
ncbi:MAG: hypothetical protein PUC58_05290 [Oscillospiraceae bacterium]|nr:hypothetical protein [Oscillospiraceae bacterium]